MIDAPYTGSGSIVFEAGLTCVVCEKHVDDDAALWVHVGEGGSVFLLPGERSPSGQDEDGEGGQGMYPIGAGCVRRHGLSEYASKGRHHG